MDPFQRTHKQRCSFDAKPVWSNSTLQRLFDSKKPGHPQWTAESKRQAIGLSIPRASCLAEAGSVTPSWWQAPSLYAAWSQAIACYDWLYYLTPLPLFNFLLFGFEILIDL